MSEQDPRSEQVPIDYQPDQTLRSIRRSIGLLVFLTFVNTILFGGAIAGPALSAFAKDQWTRYQAAKAQRAAATQAAAAATQAAAAATQMAAAEAIAREQALADQAEAMAFLWPVGSLVFAEDFAVGTLPIVGTTSATMPATRNSGIRDSAAAAATLPVRLKAEVGRSETILFAHARRSRPDSPERFVIVSLDLELQRDSSGRSVMTRTFSPAGDGHFKNVLQTTEFHSINLSRTIRPRGASPEPPALRFFAGQPDPLDESRWTIRYEFGEGSGTFYCRLLADDRIGIGVDGPLRSIFR